MDANRAATAARATLALTMEASLDGDGAGAAGVAAGAAVVTVVAAVVGALKLLTVAVRLEPAVASSAFKAVAKVAANPVPVMVLLAVEAAVAVAKVRE